MRQDIVEMRLTCTMASAMNWSSFPRNIQICSSMARAAFAVGLATNIPPHNFGEVVRAAVFLIENRDVMTALLLDSHQGTSTSRSAARSFPIARRSGTFMRRECGSIKAQGEWKNRSARASGT